MTGMGRPVICSVTVMTSEHAGRGRSDVVDGIVNCADAVQGQEEGVGHVLYVDEFPMASPSPFISRTGARPAATARVFGIIRFRSQSVLPSTEPVMLNKRKHTALNAPRPRGPADMEASAVCLGLPANQAHRRQWRVLGDRLTLRSTVKRRVCEGWTNDTGSPPFVVLAVKSVHYRSGSDGVDLLIFCLPLQRFSHQGPCGQMADRIYAGQ